MRQLILLFLFLLSFDAMGQITSTTNILDEESSSASKIIENAYGIRSFVNNESAFALLGNSQTHYGHLNNCIVTKKASLFHGQMKGKHLIEYGLYLDDLNPKGMDDHITMKHFIEGNVGLGITNPIAALDVVGDVRLGSYTGTHFDGTPSYLLGVDDNGKVIKTPFSNSNTNSSVIDSNRVEISILKNYISQLEERLAQLELQQDESLNQIQVTLSNAIDIEQPFISQNLPNPSSGHTNIKYYIPETSKTAIIKFYSLSGQIMKEVNIDVLGQGEVSLDVEKMVNGNYMYALVVDGQLVETKTMAIVK